MHAEQRRRIADSFRAHSEVPKHSLILLQGGASANRYDTDVEIIFRQESFFNYLFGVREPDCFGAINVESGNATLFIPRLPEAYAVWMGKIQPPSHFQEVYGVENVQFVDELPEFVAKYAPEKLYLLEGTNSDSGLVAKHAQFEGIEKYPLDKKLLHAMLSNQRVIKTKHELDLLRWVNKISSAAHVSVMQNIKPGMVEFQLESEFLHYCYLHGGCRFVAYTCICGSGPHGAVLHYGHAGAPNDRVIKDGEMCMFDMGAEYHCYCSDISCSYPANGKFTADQRAIYEAVLDANLAVQKAIKPGVEWLDMHDLSLRVIAKHLINHGILRGTVDELMEHDIPAMFMPHGLGHLMGLDVHDVGGYPEGCKPRSQRPGFRSLRTTRTLEEGMVLTVEPGCYFIDALLDKALADPVISKYFNNDVLQRFRGTGGIRIEDDVIVTATGSENMTQVPRTVEQIERAMQKLPWN